ncbi:amino acid ABC transporter membrane protein (PAAT family) [Aliiruegeria haliotis]|uniref:Amino acid ABC transporter membrane protein (PAAT family) n=1 Tax=Aliiruegeria haliotis TaxID=1280846 RepID=A0A2T0RRR3_9RHOB|nr:amino acid ABC transporter permease [Aliiruegeria haliotis]PRY23858.1 amino acid ABC transporter membrane protein (PAAT family) [Aliiruegeria haliotis]
MMQMLALLEDRRIRLITASLASLLLFMALDIRGSMLGEMLRPAIGEPADSGLYGRFATGLVATFLLGVNLVVLDLLPRRLQLPVVWLELLALFLAFFLSFGLDFAFIQKKLWFLISQGAVTTIYVSLISIAIACVIAMVAAVAKLSSNPLFFGVSTFYISFFRGLPLLMQIYLIYLGLPQLGFVVDPIPAGIAALSICYGAYMAEIFRAGILGVPRGQSEAAAALGLKGPQIFTKVVMPQAMRLIVPPTGNQFIAMLKDSSLVSVVGVWELTFLAKTAGKSEFKHVEMLITASLIYWAMSICFELIQARIERHYTKSDLR